MAGFAPAIDVFGTPDEKNLDASDKARA